MKSTPKQELIDFASKYAYDQRGIYFISSYANALLRIMDRYNDDVDRTALFYLKADLEDLIDEEIKIAIRAYEKKLKSAGEKRIVAENKLAGFKHKFLALYEKAQTSV